MKNYNCRDDVTILVNTCDMYEDAWDPFFKLFKIQWSDCPYRFVLNTESKDYKTELFDVRAVHPDEKMPWGKRIKYALNTIQSDYVVFMLEDCFLQSKVNSDSFYEMLEYMKENDDVGVIICRHTEKQKTAFDEKYFSRDCVTGTVRIVAMAAIYRKNYLLNIIDDNESIWEFEVNASKRSRKFPQKVLQYNNAYPIIFEYYDAIERGYGITKRKWLPKNKELFDKYGIEVDFDNLGVYDESVDGTSVHQKKQKISIFEKIRKNIENSRIYRANVAEARTVAKKCKYCAGNLSVFGKPKIIGIENLTIGNKCCINEGVYINSRQSVIIGDNVTISANAMIVSAGYDVERFMKTGERVHLESGCICIYDNCWICAGAIILPNVHITGSNVIIGAGAVVTHSFSESNVLIAGNPAKIVKRYSASETDN